MYLDPNEGLTSEASEESSSLILVTSTKVENNDKI